MPKLTYVVGSGGETRSVDIGDSCSIGSLAGNTILLDASLGVSRRHCQVLKIQSGYEIADLGSTNGTKVNGTPVKKQKLKNGDKIEVGKVTFTFDDGSGASSGGDDEISIEEPAGEASAPAAASRGTGGGASDQCVLVHAGGDKDGQKIALDKQRVTFGRNAKNSVVLTDSGASGFHAEIAREGGAYVLRDLGSTNGTMVDGEPVSETALQHGARIRMGGTRFVFVDPTVSDFEKAMAAVDDLGSEWGLLRAEMDMTRVQEARRSQAILVVGALVIVLGGGAYVMTHPELFSGERKNIATVDGNKLADPSFEEKQGSDWSARADSPTKARGTDDRSDGPAKQGSAFFAVARDGAPGACAAAVSPASTAIAVSPGKPVEFGAAIRVTGGGRAGARVVWIDRPDAANGHEIGASASPLTAASEWTVVKGTATPPEGARSARLELVNAAGGTAFFDDVYFVVGGSANVEEKRDGQVVLSGTADAQTTIARGDVKLLVSGAVVGGSLTTDAVGDPTRHGDRAGSQTVTKGGLRASGNLVDPRSGEAPAFTVDLDSKDGRTVTLNAVLPNAEAGWIAILPDEFVKAGIGVRTEGEFRRATDPHLFDKVESVTFGGDHRFRVQRAQGASPLRMALSRVGDRWEVAFGATDGKLSIEIDTDSAALIADVEKLRQDASTAKQQGRLGLAIKKFQLLEANYPGGSAEATTVNTEWTTLDNEARAALERTQAKAAGAIEFRDLAELRTARAEADELMKKYAEHGVADKAKDIVTGTEGAIEKLRVAADERAAAPVLRKAEDFSAHKMATLAETMYREVVERFPGTEAAKKAGEALAKRKN